MCLYLNLKLLLRSMKLIRKIDANNLEIVFFFTRTILQSAFKKHLNKSKEGLKVRGKLYFSGSLAVLFFFFFFLFLFEQGIPTFLFYMDTPLWEPYPFLPAPYCFAHHTCPPLAFTWVGQNLSQLQGLYTYSPPWQASLLKTSTAAFSYPSHYFFQ